MEGKDQITVEIDLEKILMLELRAKNMADFSHEAMEDILGLTQTGYAVVCNNKTADRALDESELLEYYPNRFEYDLATEGDDAVNFISGYGRNFNDNVLLVLRNYQSADDEVQEEIGKSLKSYHEKHFFSSGSPDSLLLVTGAGPDDLTKYDGTLHARILVAQ